MEKKQQILVIGGGTAYENDNAYLAALKNKEVKLEYMLAHRDWKNELPEQLDEFFLVYVPHMPNASNAQYEEWKILFEKIIHLLDDNLILIGHSLGGIFLAKYLSENQIGKKIQKTFLVAAPFDDDGIIGEQLYSFVRGGNLQNLEKQSGEVFLYFSEDDFIVPFSHLAKYQKELPNAHVRAFKDRNHFLQANIPELIIDIKK